MRSVLVRMIHGRAVRGRNHAAGQARETERAEQSPFHALAARDWLVLVARRIGRIRARRIRKRRRGRVGWHRRIGQGTRIQFPFRLRCSAEVSSPASIRAVRQRCRAEGPGVPGARVLRAGVVVHVATPKARGVRIRECCRGLSVSCIRRGENRKPQGCAEGEPSDSHLASPFLCASTYHTRLTTRNECCTEWSNDRNLKGGITSCVLTSSR